MVRRTQGLLWSLAACMPLAMPCRADVIRSAPADMLPATAAEQPADKVADEPAETIADEPADLVADEPAPPEVENQVAGGGQFQ